MSPSIPLLFMGEEYGEKAAFPYFIEHSDPKLVEAVREGPKAEFNLSSEEGPDPQNLQTFLDAKLKGPGDDIRCLTLQDFHRELIQIRKSPAFDSFNLATLKTTVIDKQALVVSWESSGSEYVLIINFDSASINFQPKTNASLQYKKQLDSTEKRWLGRGTSVSESFSSDITLEVKPEQAVLLQTEGRLTS